MVMIAITYIQHIHNNDYHDYHFVISKCIEPSDITWDHCDQSFGVWFPKSYCSRLSERYGDDVSLDILLSNLLK